MPHRKKKKFIDKKNAQTFRLVHRSQKDPLQASEDVGQRVLLPVVDKEVEERKEEQRGFGVFYEDNYNYLQHLKDVNETIELEAVDHFKIPSVTVPGKQKGERLHLPSTVFASTTETEVGLLNKAAPISGPRLDWDPDIVAGLDEDFDYEDPDNALDDDFIVMANAPTSAGGAAEREGGTDDDSDVASDIVDVSDEDGDRFGGEMFENEETRSRFTAYSMTSSVIRRTGGLTLLDDRFEKVYEEYDESEIGPLDNEDIDGRVDPNSHILDSVVAEYEKNREKINLPDVVESVATTTAEMDSDKEYDEDEADLVKMVMEEPQTKWDCESIISTYSNLYNHPKLISEPSNNKNNISITLSSKLGIPLDGMAITGPTRKQIEKELHELQRCDRAGTYRPKGETPEEKRARKQAIKEERKERRVEKKANKTAFGEEKIRQEKEQLNLKQNLQGVKML